MLLIFCQEMLIIILRQPHMEKKCSHTPPNPIPSLKGRVMLKINFELFFGTY